jgi:hypothetical protein
MTPLEETIEIWKVLSKTGSSDKLDVIKMLHERCILHKIKYIHNCPLCDIYYPTNGPYYPSCKKCPWPGKGGVRCQEESHYGDWSYCHSHSERKYWATKIVQLLEEVKDEIDNN